MEFGNLTKFTQLGSHRAKATASLLTTCCQKLLCSAKISSEKTLKVQNGLSYRHIRLLFISICNLPATRLPFCFAMTTLARASLVTRSGVWLIGTALSLCDGPRWEPPPDASHTGNGIPVSVEMVVGGFRQGAKLWDVRRHRGKHVGCVAAQLDLTISSLANYPRVWTRWRAT